MLFRSESEEELYQSRIEDFTELQSIFYAPGMEDLTESNFRQGEIAYNTFQEFRELLKTGPDVSVVDTIALQKRTDILAFHPDALINLSSDQAEELQENFTEIFARLGQRREWCKRLYAQSLSFMS